MEIVQPAEVLAAASEAMQLEEQTQLPAAATEALEELQTEGKKTSATKKRSSNVKRANERAGIKLPPGRIQKIIKANQTVPRSSPSAAVFVAAVVEDIVKEIIAGADVKSAERGMRRITPQDINKFLTEEGSAYMHVLGDAFVAHGGVGQVADVAASTATKKRKRSTAASGEAGVKKVKKAGAAKPKKTIKKTSVKKKKSSSTTTKAKSVTKKASSRKATSA